MKAVQIENNKMLVTNGEDRSFNDLIESIENRNVILVVGRGFEVNTESNDNKIIFNNLKPESDLYDLILYYLKRQYNSNALDFTELNLDSNFSVRDGNIKKKRNIYDAIAETIKNLELSIRDVNTRLLKLLKTGYFRFVFTTSFSPLVEIAMKEQWGEENVRVLNVLDNNILNTDILDSELDLLTPTVYYLFGKADDKNSFVVTDNDALRIIQKWMYKMSDSKVIESTHKKHVLALGCIQDDWLFRFIWFVLKGENNLPHGSVGKYAKSDSLENFLRRNNILEKIDADLFVDRIISALNQQQSTKKLNKLGSTCDVFISYSRRDGDIAEEVYKALTEQGLDVWYDKYNLGGRGGYYMKEIFHSIETCKMFIPILTPTISSQRSENHPYRLEWDCAVNGPISQRGARCCIPVVDSEYDLDTKAFEDNIHDKIKGQDAYIFHRLAPDFNNWAKKVNEIIKKEYNYDK